MNLRHIHGLADGVVAFDEVGIYNSAPIPEGLTLLRRLNQCGAAPEAVPSGDERLSCERWTGCGSGRVLELCLHEKGHSIPAEWVGEGLEWLEKLSP